MIGIVVDMIMHNKADYQKKWYQVSDFEMKLYQKMKVKKWKNKMPTFNEDTFDICIYAKIKSDTNFENKKKKIELLYT